MGKRRNALSPDPVPAEARLWLPWAILAGAVLLAYFNALPGILFWDDEVLILNNVFLRSFRYLHEIFTTSMMAGGGVLNNYYRPVQNVLLLLQYQLWGPWPAGYHAVNILFHLANTALLFLLARRLSSCVRTAFWAALLYALHPVQNETVNYASHLNSLSTFFFGMLALHLHVRGRRWNSLLSWAACLLSKEEGVVFFLIFLLHDLMRVDEHPPRPQERLRGLLGLWPHALVLGTYLVLHVTVFNFLRLPLAEYGAQAGAYAGVGLRLLTFAKAFCVYLRLLILPVGLHFDRDMLPVSSLTQPDAWACVVLAAAAVFALWKASRDLPAARFGLCWFLAGFLPYCGLVPFNNILAEHFLYLPSAGLFLALADLGVRRLGSRWMFLLVPLFAFWLVQNWRRNADWQDPARLYRTTLAGNPRSFRAANNLGAEYFRKGLLLEAKEAFELALGTNPQYAPALNNVGAVVEAQGKPDEALGWYRRAALADPAYALAHRNLATILFQRRSLREARSEAEAAIALHPAYAEAWELLGAIAFDLQDLPASLAAFEKAASLNPSPQILANLAIVRERAEKTP
ncbi:MAG: tetratricopeptide repeat protein [Elusimicrobiota bacterium]